LTGERRSASVLPQRRSYARVVRHTPWPSLWTRPAIGLVLQLAIARRRGSGEWAGCDNRVVGGDVIQ